jgi:hypothetical protein
MKCPFKYQCLFYDKATPECNEDGKFRECKVWRSWIIKEINKMRSKGKEENNETLQVEKDLS